MERKNYYVVRDIGIPPGLINERRPHVKPGLKSRIGRQSAAQPADITSVRSNRPTIYSYDEDGEIDGVIQVPEAWIVAGDMSGETWTTAAEMRDTFAERLGDELGVNPEALGENKLTAVVMTHVEVLAELANNPVFWGEGVG
ncbi:hypothetical protein LCGC14_0933870 [marine sediment metagenome]|uniref:Uncharacterized protein n=1 Tax=marine sediment metagenome TaxID=412755 RepID=A0A0F9NRP6_9ZZZZ